METGGSVHPDGMQCVQHEVIEDNNAPVCGWCPSARRRWWMHCKNLR